MVSLSVFSLRVLRFFFLSRFLYFIPSGSVSLLCYWCLYCLGLHVGSISVGFHGGFFGCFPKNPVVNLETLALTTICKPIANRLKKEAGLHPNFRYFIIDFAQVLSLLSTFFFFHIWVPFIFCCNCLILGFGFFCWFGFCFLHLYCRNSSVFTNLYMGYLSNTIDTCYNYELQPKFCANWYLCIWDEVS